MRNILEYPITNQERIDTLKQIQADILAEQSVGDLRAEILQECIDTIKDKSARLQLSCDEEALNEITKLQTWHADRLYESRQQAGYFLKHNGLEPGMWAKWREDPPPLQAYKNSTDLILLAIIDVLTQEGIVAWPGDATSCVSQLVHAQLNSRKRLISALERIVHAYTADTDDLREMAEDAILAEKPIE